MAKLPAMDRRIFLAGAFALSGCATLPPSTAAPSFGPFAELEPIFAARTGPEGISIRVASNGCTTRDDFAVHRQRQGGLVGLAFGRKRLDTCTAVPESTAVLAFSWSELGLSPGTPVVVLNPFAGPVAARQ